MKLLSKSLLIITLVFTGYLKAEQLPLRIVADERKLLQYQVNNTAQGPSAELLQMILAQASLHGRIEFMPWSRAFNIAKNRPNTMLLTVIRTPEREALFHWLLKVSDVVKSFISLKALPENYITSIEQAKTKVVAVVRGSASHHFLTSKSFSEGVNLYVVSSVDETISMLLNKKVDLVFTPPAVFANYFAAKNLKGEDYIHYSSFPETKKEGYIALNKASDPALAEMLIKASSAVKKSDNYQRLLKYKPLISE
ncbi:substrate-binding periplasmic protein [Thalassotalea ganghwensis]